MSLNELSLIDIISLSIGAVIIILLIIVLIKTFVYKSPDLTPQIIDLKNQLNDMRMKQLELQNQSITQEQQMFQNSQKSMNDNLNKIMDMVNSQLLQSQKSINSSLVQSNTVFGEIQKKLGSLESTTQRIQEISKDISSLQDILRAPKLRGNLGEFMLGEMLRNTLPGTAFEEQYPFKDGTKVDAVIKLGNNMVPIDSKFPLDSFQRYTELSSDADKRKAKTEFIKAIKKQIDSIAEKYIKPFEGTYDFAMMYIPAENVYYELLVNDAEKEYELFEYSMAKRVIPVSPNTFYAYLMAIVYGLKGFVIEKQSRIIIQELAGIQKEFNNFRLEFATLGKHLNNSGNKFNELNKSAAKLNEQVSKITGADDYADIETVTLMPIGQS